MPKRPPHARRKKKKEAKYIIHIPEHDGRFEFARTKIEHREKMRDSGCFSKFTLQQRTLQRFRLLGMTGGIVLSLKLARVCRAARDAIDTPAYWRDLVNFFVPKISGNCGTRFLQSVRTRSCAAWIGDSSSADGDSSDP